MPALSKRLYMRGIGKDVIEADLFQNLSHYGKISEVKILSSWSLHLRSTNHGELTRGHSDYAFVQYNSEEDASRVLETYKSQPLMGKRVVIEFAHPLRKDMSSISSSGCSPKSYVPYKCSKVRHPVVVLGLPRDMRWQELKDFGRSFGMLVAYCDLDKTEEGRGFIEYFTREDAQYAAKNLNGKRIGGQKVYVVDHEDMRAGSIRGRSWERQARSPKRRVFDNNVQVHDRTVTRGLSSRQVYSPVRRLHDAGSGNLEHRHSNGGTKGCSYSMACSTGYKEQVDWAYNMKNSVSPVIEAVHYEGHGSEYPRFQSCYDVGAYYDESVDYDSRHDICQVPRLFDPYQ